MTAELRWIFLLLHFTAEAAGVNFSFVIVRDGDDVTLPCYAGTGDQRRCDGTEWTFAGSGSSSLVIVFKEGKFHADVSSKSDRLRVTEKCSLVIEKVSVDDAGRYTCRKFKEGWQQGEAAVVSVSVVTMTEQKVSGDDDDDDEVTLTCSVRTYGRCEHSVQWLVDDEHKKKETSPFSCSDSVKTSEFNQKKKSRRCKVRDHRGNTERLFEFKTQRSTGGDTTTTAATTKSTTTATTKTTTTTTTAVYLTTTTNMMTSEGTKNSVWWVYLLVGVASVFLVVVVVWFFIRQKKKKTSETEPETDQNQADPEGVAYVSVSFTKTTRTRDQVKGHGDEDDAVTYSSVRAPPPSSSSDPRDLYATVNKPKK